MNATLLLPPAARPAPGAAGLLWAVAGLIDRARRALGARTAGTGGDTAADTADGWALWRAATGGDPASARALVARLTPPALALARQVLGRHEDAEDTVQESFLRLWSATPADQTSAQIGTYFHTIVLNRCRSQLARQRELAVAPDELTALQDGAQPAGPDAHAADRLDTASLHTALHAALGRLPARQRLALALWAYADADAAAIGRALDIDANAAHQLLHRAKRSLRAALSPAEL